MGEETGDLGETPEVKRIFEMMDELFLEVRVDGNCARVPLEFRPQKTEVSMKEGDDAIMGSFNNVRRQLRPLVCRLAELDPDFFNARLKIFLLEWPERHREENLILFWSLKFCIEVQADFLSFKQS